MGWKKDKPAYRITFEDEDGNVVTDLKPEIEEEKPEEKPKSNLPEGLPEPKIHSDIGEGWHPLLSELHQRVSEIDPSYQLDQVKEKFGQLRFYISHKEEGHDWDKFKKIESIVEEYEAKSAFVCQECGNKNCEGHDNA